MSHISRLDKLRIDETLAPYVVQEFPLSRWTTCPLFEAKRASVREDAIQSIRLCPRRLRKGAEKTQSRPGLGANNTLAVAFASPDTPWQPRHV